MIMMMMMMTFIGAVLVKLIICLEEVADIYGFELFIVYT